MRQRALRLLARRDFAVAELRQRLLTDAQADAVEAVIADLCAQGWIDEARAARERARRWADRAYGRLRAEQDLRARGFPEEVIQLALEELFGDEERVARSLVESRFPTAEADVLCRARAARYLLRRGFPPDLVVALLGEAC